VKVPVTVSPSAACGTAATSLPPALRRRGDLALPQRGDQVAPVGDAAVRLTGGIAPVDMVLAAAVHRLAHLFAEAGR
jgi:hypothetical protein